jgi:hypothetical protein
LKGAFVSKKPLNIVNVATKPMDCSANITADSEHVVALLISEAETHMRDKEKMLADQIAKGEKQLKDNEALIEKHFDEVVHDIQSKHNKLVKALNEAGFCDSNVVVQSIPCPHDIQDIKPVIIIETRLGNNHYCLVKKDSYIVPKQILELMEIADKLSDNLEESRRKLLSMRCERERSIPSLERWAKGQVARAVLSDTDSIASALLEKLSGSMPKFLTSD